MDTKSTPSLISGIAEIADQYDTYILDVWGVLHNGVEAYQGVIPCLQELKSRGKEILLLSNSPNRASEVSQDLSTRFGIQEGTHFDHIVTSGEATWQALKNYIRQTAYVFWDQEHPTALQGHDIKVTYDIENADFILGSLFPAGAQFEDYHPVLEIARSKNLPFLCANPDKVVNIGNNIHLCAGGVADDYIDRGGEVIWFGKPHLDIYKQAFTKLGLADEQADKTRVLAIGDALRTDVIGANTAGIDVLWNLVGIHWEELRKPESREGIHTENLTKTLEEFGAHPTALLRGLKW